MSVAQASDEAASMGYTGHEGVLIHGIMKGAPASGKLEPGDIVTSLNGKSVATSTELRDEIAANKPGSDVSFGVFRDGKTQDVVVRIGEAPSMDGQKVSEATPARAAMKLRSWDCSLAMWATVISKTA